MRPLVGSINRLIIFMVVVLPQPDGPTSTHSSPSATSRLSSWTATLPSAYRLLTRSSRIIGCVVASNRGPLGRRPRGERPRLAHLVGLGGAAHQRHLARGAPASHPHRHRGRGRARGVGAARAAGPTLPEDPGADPGGH